MKYVTLLLFFAGFFVSQSFATPYSNEIPYSVQHVDNDEFIVAGAVDAIIENLEVTLRITDQNDKTISVAQTMPDVDKNFAFNVTKKGTLWKNVVDYSIIVNYQKPDVDSEFNGRDIGSSQGIFGPPVIEIPKLLSPLKQFESGIPIDEISCKENLQLVIRVNNDSPACVKPATRTDLIHRGWAKPDERSLAFDYSKNCEAPLKCEHDKTSLDRTTYPLITILPPDRDPDPHRIILQIGVNDTTYWKNESDVPIILTSEDGTWSTGLISPNDGKVVKFNHTAFYKYRGLPSTTINGRIAIISDQTEFLPILEKLQIAREIIAVDMGNPITGIGVGNADNVLDITVHEDELKKNPDAEQYYKKRYHDMIPFDVPIRIEFGHVILTD